MKEQVTWAICKMNMLLHGLTSAITWGETQVAYTIRRSARRKKTVAVTVDPTGSVDRPATPARAVSRPAALAA